MSQRKGISKLFPDTQLNKMSGDVQESGTSPLAGISERPIRWIKVNNVIFTGLDDGLYHTQYGQRVTLVHDTSHKVVAYWNEATNTGSDASKSSVVGAIAMVVMLTAIAYYGGIWNFIWKGISEWWLTIFIIFCFSLYALVWTPIFAFRELKRQNEGHKMLENLKK
jgi:hypothetical protein